MAVRNTIMNGAMVGCFIKATRMLEQKFPNMPKDVRRVLAGSTGGLIGSAMSYPFEMMRAAAMHNHSFHDIVAQVMTPHQPHSLSELSGRERGGDG